MAMSKVFKVVAVFGILFMGTAHAQSSIPLIVTIPFDFYVGDKLLPASDYSATVDIRLHQIVIREMDGPAGALGLYFPVTTETNAVPDACQLVFNKYGNDRIFLSRIWHQGVRPGVELP